MTPLFAVIIPVRNGAAFVRGAVRSVLAQTHAAFEVVVIDDGSTDGTAEQLACFRDPRLQIVRRLPAGAGAARNAAIALTTAPYVAFLDADDRWMPRKLEIEAATLERLGWPEGILYSGYWMTDASYRPVRHVRCGRASGMILEAAVADPSLLLPSAAVVHRVVLEATGGFHEAAAPHEDRVFFLQACARFPAWPTGRSLSVYRRAGGLQRAVLADFDAALAAEISCIEATCCGPLALRRAEIEAFHLRFLARKFVMNGHLGHARRLARAAGLRDFGGGARGRLAWLSVQIGVNLLAPAAAVAGRLQGIRGSPGDGEEARFWRALRGPLGARPEREKRAAPRRAA